jgi:hypothetical protein
MGVAPDDDTAVADEIATSLDSAPLVELLLVESPCGEQPHNAAHRTTATIHPDQPQHRDRRPTVSR